MILLQYYAHDLNVAAVGAAFRHLTHDHMFYNNYNKCYLVSL